ncbi:MAG: hypothetical protein RR454_05825 [Clostridia bacterium]
MKKIILSLVLVIIMIMASSTLACYTSEGSITSGSINSGEEKSLEIDGFYTFTKTIRVEKNQKFMISFVFDGGKAGVDYSLYYNVFYNPLGKTQIPLNIKLVKTDKSGAPLEKQGKLLYLNDYDFPNGPQKLFFDEGQKNYYRLEFEFAQQNQNDPIYYNDIKIQLQGVAQTKASNYQASDIFYQINYAQQLLESMTEQERKAIFGYQYINNEMIRAQVKIFNYSTFPKITTKNDTFYIQPFIPQVLGADGKKVLDCSQSIIFGKTDQVDSWFTKYIYDYETATWYYNIKGISLPNLTWNDVKAILHSSDSQWKPIVFK